MTREEIQAVSPGEVLIYDRGFPWERLHRVVAVVKGRRCLYTPWGDYDREIDESIECEYWREATGGERKGFLDAAIEARKYHTKMLAKVRFVLSHITEGEWYEKETE